MTCFKLLSVVCVFLLFQSTFAAFGKETTQVDVGCHTFRGTVKCRNGSSILSNATVQLYESDYLGDDLLETKKLAHFVQNPKSAAFYWRGCYDDGNVLFFGPKFQHMELYYVFKNVCRPGDSYTAKDVLHEKTTYVLDGDEAYLV